MTTYQKNLIKLACRVWDVDTMCSQKQGSVRARYAYFWVLYMRGITMSEIGKFPNRHYTHCLVSYGISKHHKLYEEDEEYKAKYEKMIGLLKTLKEPSLLDGVEHKAFPKK